MNEESKDTRFDPVDVDLKNPAWAAFLAWLWPGAGHIYQGRYGKAILFMSCILVTYFWGLAMGQGHVVYSSFRQNDVRYQYILQLGVGLPALPAVVQSYLAENGEPLFGGFMAPPDGEVYEQEHDAKALWHWDLGLNFELATLFTMVAGLLNVLVIYDAYAGPAFGEPEGRAGALAPGDGEAIQRKREGLSSNLMMLGVILGIIIALNFRPRFDVDSRLLTYAMAAGGGLLGAGLSRALSSTLSGFLHRLPADTDVSGPSP